MHVSRIIDSKIYAVGFQGEIQSIEKTMHDALGFFKATPRLEVDERSGREPIFKAKYASLELECHIDDLKTSLLHWYCYKGIFGPYGDIMQISCRTVECFPPENSFVEYQIDFIGRRAFVKPGLSADIVPFVRDAQGNLFLVAIRRRKNPGKGKVALAGGFIDVRGKTMETGAECSCRESVEEMKLSIIPAGDGIGKFHHAPNADFLPVIVCLSQIRLRTSLRLVGTYFTSDDEYVEGLDEKRVYQTTAYALVIPTSRSLETGDVAKLFVAGDDAGEIVVIPYDHLHKTEFAFGHHDEIVRDAMKIAEAECAAM